MLNFMYKEIIALITRINTIHIHIIQVWPKLVSYTCQIVIITKNARNRRLEHNYVKF